MKINIESSSDNPEFEDIMECIQNIASIPRGSMPMARGIGLDWGNISKIPGDLENDYAVDAAQQYATYEDRAELSEVTFEHNQETGETEVNLVFEEGEADE